MLLLSHGTLLVRRTRSTKDMSGERVYRFCAERSVKISMCSLKTHKLANDEANQGLHQPSTSPTVNQLSQTTSLPLTSLTRCCKLRPVQDCGAITLIDLLRYHHWRPRQHAFPYQSSHTSKDVATICHHGPSQNGGVHSSTSSERPAWLLHSHVVRLQSNTTSTMPLKLCGIGR